MNTNRPPQYFGKDLETMYFAKNYHKWILYEFAPYLGNVIAEIGAGTGNFSSFLIEKGVEHLIAFEPSNNMFPLLDDRLGKANKVKTINAFFRDKAHQYENTFDSVLYVNVLEHIEDDKNELSYAYKTVKEKGHLLIFVPALSFLYSDLDKKVGHYRRYHKQGLVELIQSAGFSIKKVKYFDISGIIPWYFAFVLFKKTTTEGNVSLYDRLIVPVMRKFESIITPIIGKNLLLVAQKA